MKTVEDIMAWIKLLPGTVTDCEFWSLFLNDSKISMCSRFHDIAVYKDGYDDPGAIRLAYM